MNDKLSRKAPAKRSGSSPTHQQTEVALRKVYHGRIKVGALVECRQDDGTRQGSRHLDCVKRISTRTRGLDGE